ncbi:unnamed protein product [Candida parapsilosis]
MTCCKNTLSLDLYPRDILQQIVFKAGASNLIELLSSKEFLQQNPNLKSAIDYEMTENSYTYDNRSAKPNRLIYWTSIKKVNTSDFKNSKEFEEFYDYCVRASTETQMNLYYKVEFAPDFLELLGLLQNLKSSNSVKLFLNLDFTSCHLHFVDLTQLFASMSHLKDCLIGFSITGGYMTNFKGIIDLEELRDVEELSISGCKVSGSFSRCRKLQKLSFVPIDGDKSLFDILELPCSLKCLEFTDYSASEPRSHDGATFPCLDSISICCFEDPLPILVSDVIRLMTGPNTQNIEYSYESDDCVDDFISLVKEASKVKGFTLKRLSIEGHLSKPIDIYPSESFELLYADDEKVTGQLQLPSTLKKLSMGDDYGFNPQIIKHLPPRLDYLRLMNKGGSWNNVYTGFPMTLKCLELPRTGIKDVVGFAFPQTLEELDLSSNEIESIEGVAFPRCLQSLNLSFNEIKEVSGVKFPVTLKQLNLLGNPIESVDLSHNEFFETLRVETLYIGCKHPGNLSYNLPNTLQDLHFNLCENLCQEFCGNLVSIRLDSCSLSSGELFKKQSKLRYLSISNCRLVDVSVNYPQSLEEVHLISNGLSRVPTQLGQLSNLKKLRLSDNEIPRAVIEFKQNTLEVLDLSYNKIETIQLSFSDGPTQLKQIDLSQNELKSITMGHLGHGNGTFHNNLYELDLAYNMLMGEQVLALVSTLPRSVQCLWADSDTGGVLRAVNYL